MPSDTYPLVEPNRTELEPWRQVLLDAAGIVRQGWCKHSLVRPDNTYCALGAIGLASGMVVEDDYRCLDRIHKLEATKQLALLVGGSVWSWNDRTAKDAETVASTMERVALSGHRE